MRGIDGVINGYYRTGTSIVWRILQQSNPETIILYEPHSVGLHNDFRTFNPNANFVNPLHGMPIYKPYFMVSDDVRRKFLETAKPKPVYTKDDFEDAIKTVAMFNDIDKRVIIQSNQLHPILHEFAEYFDCNYVHIVRDPAEVLYSHAGSPSKLKRRIQQFLATHTPNYMIAKWMSHGNSGKFELRYLTSSSPRRVSLRHGGLRMKRSEVAVEPHKGRVKRPDGATLWATPSCNCYIGRFINLLVNMHDMELMLKLKLFEPRKGKRILIEETIRQFKDCVNDWIQALHQLGEKPTRTAVHRFAYKKLRQKYSQLHTDVLQEAMDLAIEIYRAWLNNPNKGKEIPRFDKDCIYFEGRCVKFDRHFISLPLAGKRVWLPMHVPARFKQYLQHKHGRVILKKVKDEYYVYVSVNVPEHKPYEPRGWFGVDIGIRHIIVVSDAEGEVNWFLNSAIGWKKNMECRISGLQRLKDKKVKKGVWRVLKRFSGKVKNRQRYINHVIAKQLVLMAKMWRYGIAIENLRGLRRGKVGKRHRKRLHKWAYKDLIDKIVYKAKLHGVPVVFVNPKGTSRTCSRCGAKGVVKGRIFVCRKCGLKLDRDLNASRNIALRAPLHFESFRKEVVL